MTAVDHIRARTALVPRVGIVLGSGLGAVADAVQDAVSFAYAELPGFPQGSVAGHARALHLGTLAGVPVAVFQGRAHLYEGVEAASLTVPVRTLRALGAEVILLTNAAGSLRAGVTPGRLMAITDHINLMGTNPLIGPNDDALGERFPDMCFAYDRELLKLAKEVALKEQIAVQQGVFVAVAGPNLETRAEYRFLRLIGADCVGMSTVPEVIVGVHAKLRNLGFSVVTDLCLADALQPVSLAEIIRTANAAEPRLRRLVRAVIEAM